MLETGLGRAVNLAIAALPGCTLPPDLGPSARYFARDITPAFEDRDGTMDVPTGPGLGTEPLEETLDQVTVNQLIIKAAP
jgi:O-succinylbenzoate synthase